MRDMDTSNPERKSRVKQVIQVVQLIMLFKLGELFKHLASEFSKLETIEEILKWNGHLLRLNNDKNLVNLYNIWSADYFRPPSRVDNIIKYGGAARFKEWLQNTQWESVGFRINEFYELVSSMMLYGRRLSNRGLFSLGRYQNFWLTVQLDPWAISLPKGYSQEDPLRRNPTAMRVLGLQYKPLDHETLETLLFFPLGHILYAESFQQAKSSDFDMMEWMRTPYVVAIGIQHNSKPEVDDRTKEAVFYFIYSPNFGGKEGQIRAVASNDDDDDTQHIDLCCDQPPYSVARVVSQPDEFLTPDLIWMVTEKLSIKLKPLSDSGHIPEMVETHVEPNSRHRIGLFPSDVRRY